MAWTGLKQNSEYTAQITPYRNKIYAEIIVKHKDRGFHSVELNLWLPVLSKTFGTMFKNEPTEKDWQNANNWVSEQLRLITEYGTVMVTKPQHILDNDAFKNKS